MGVRGPRFVFSQITRSQSLVVQSPSSAPLPSAPSPLLCARAFGTPPVQAGATV